MLGGGTFTAQNKVLNGAYFNFISASKASAALSERGVATMPLELDWGADGAVFEVTPEDFQKNSLKIFGYPYMHAKMKGLRDLFMNIKTLYAYKLTTGGVKASNTFATAKCCGTRGNDLKVVISANVDDSEAYDVKLYFGTTPVFDQTGVKAMSELGENDYVEWKTSASLAVTAGVAMTGGTNGEVSGDSHSTYLNKIEAYSYNAMGVVTEDDDVKALYVAFTKRMRDQVGAKFQTVLYGKAADYEGVINVKNAAVNSTSAADLVYWVTGAEAGCAVNKTLLNQKYTGEFTVSVDYTQSALEAAMKGGEFAFHNVNGEIRVLADINSLTTESDQKSVEIFGENQVIRVIDNIANDVAATFNTKYLGSIPNDADGRISFWNDLVKYHRELQDMRAIQDFEPDDITVNQGEAKNSVVVTSAITVTVAMAKLYMTVTVS